MSVRVKKWLGLTMGERMRVLEFAVWVQNERTARHGSSKGKH